MLVLPLILLLAELPRTTTTYQVPLFGDVSFNSQITSPKSILGFPVGERTATPEQITQLVTTWAIESDRAQRQVYAHTFEQRPLSVMIISSPANLARLDSVQRDIQKLADPRKLDDAQAEALIMSLPATAWLAYSIHGNETSGSDAALALIYYLLAGESSAITELLDTTIIFVDPMMNPDGRARFCKDLQEGRGQSPNFDNQSLLHNGSWPYGRTNHYYYDLNRDFTLGINPETIGRVKLINQWAPQLFVDAHEMGSTDTFLFSPARAPINLHLADFNASWAKTFATEQAQAFDREGWRYYTGEWNDNWYPGYSFWCSYRGSLAILYEQARLAEDGVIRPEGTIMTYRESVHHQLVSSLSNLSTLVRNHQSIRRDYWNDRKRVVSPKGPYAGATYAIMPSANHRRLREFVKVLELQGFEIFQLDRDMTVASATNQLGQPVTDLRLPAGTLMVPRLQPEARLLTTMMEFDPRIPQETLKKERREVLQKGRSIMYDTTAWCATMLHDLESYTLAQDLPTGTQPYHLEEVKTDDLEPAADRLGYVWDGADDQSVAIAARLLEQGHQVRVADRAFHFGDTTFPRGSVLLLAADQRQPLSKLHEAIVDLSQQLMIPARGIHTGWGEGDLPDLGGQHFILLRRPQIALLGHGNVSSYDFGSIWHVIDRYLGITHSHLDIESGRVDLRRYNVVVLPESYGPLPESLTKSLKPWLEQGGTLIAVGNSAAGLATEKLELSTVRLLPDVLEKLDDYEMDLLKQWLADQEPLNAASVWSHSPPSQQSFPWSDLPKRPDKDEMARRDKWRAQFMPQGAIFAARTDTEHWLTFGCREYVPTLFGRGPLLMTLEEAPVRFGSYQRAAEKRKTKDNESTVVRAGWAGVPAGYELRLRMSGLVWPEAADRITNAAYLTRERQGRGQIIMFASSPAFRGTTMGTIRLLINALVYGPGLGTNGGIDLDIALP